MEKQKSGLEFNVMRKKCTLERTGNPCWFKASIDTDTSYRVYHFPALNMVDALTHLQITALGVR